MRTRTVLVSIAVAVGLSVSGSAVVTGAHFGAFGGGSAGATVAGANTAIVPPSIDATGKADVTIPLNALLAAAPNGTTVVFPANATYRIEGTLAVLNKKNFTINGNGSTFFATTDGLHPRLRSCDQHPGWPSCREPLRNRAQWLLLGDQNLTVRDVNVIGSDRHSGPRGIYDPLLEAQHGFQVVGDSGVVLDHVSARDVWGDFVNVGVGLVGRRWTASTSVLVENSRFHGSSRQGWSITDAQHVTFAHNVVDGSRRSLIDIEANTTGDVIAFVTIRDNQLGRSRFCTVSNWGAAATEHDFVIAGNHMMTGVALKVCVRAAPHARRSNFLISGNVSSRTPNEPMVNLAYVDNVTVRNNVQQFAMNWPGRGSPQGPVTSKCSTGVVVTANRFMPRPARMPQSVQTRC
jgi:hypothetical protein